MFKQNKTLFRLLKNMFTLSVILFFLFGQNLWGSITGKITGTITDKAGNSMSGANIVIQGTLLGAAADMEGNYHILKVPPGNYSVFASMIGYKKLIKMDVVVQAGRTTHLNFLLEEAIIEGEEVVVTAERPVVEVDRTSTEFIISAKEIKLAPVVQSVKDFVKIMPGVSEDALGDIVVRGSDSRDVVMNYDGIPLDGYRSFNIFSVEEVSVKTGGLGAEYGNAQGGLITVVTKEGTDKFTGTFEYGLSPPRMRHWGVNYWDDAYHLDNNGDSRLHWDDPTWVNEIDSLTGRKVHEKIEYDDIISQSLKFDLSGPLFLKGLYFSLAGQSSWGAWSPMGARRKSLPWGDANWKITYNLIPAITIKSGGFFTQSNSLLSGGGVSFSSGGIGTQTISGLSRDMRIGGSGRHIADRNIFLPLDYSGTGKCTNQNYLLYISMSHLLSPKTYYTLKLYQQDNSRWNYDLPDTVITSTRTDASGWYYIDGGSQISYTDKSTKKIGGKFDLTSQINKNNQVTFGIDLQRYNIWKTSIFQNINSRYISRIANNFNSGEGVTPTKFAVYLADKMEFGGMVLDLGLRFDYFDFGTKYPVTYAISNLSKVYNSFTRFRNLPDELMIKPDPLKAFAPRIGLAHPITEKATVHFYYGYTYQIPDFSKIYGDYWTATSATKPDKDINKNGVIDETELYNNLNNYKTTKHFGNPYVTYEKSINFEAGMDWNFFRDFILTSTLYYRSGEDQMRRGFSPIFWDPSVKAEAHDISQYSNTEYEDAKGFEFLLKKRFGRIFSLQASVDINWVTNGRSGERYRTYVPGGAFIEKYYFTRYTGDTNGDGVVNENDSGAEVPVPMPDAQLEMIRNQANEHVAELRELLGDELRTVEGIDGLYYYSTHYSTSGIPKETVERRMTMGLLFYLTLPENYGPQVLGFHILENINVNLYYRLQDGLPYQYSSMDGSALWRSAPLSSTTDIRLEKKFIFSGINSIIFLSVSNLFNNKELNNNSGFTRNINMNEYINYGLEGYSPIADAGSDFHGKTDGGIYLGRPRSVKFGLRITF